LRDHLHNKSYYCVCPLCLADARPFCQTARRLPSTPRTAAEARKALLQQVLVDRERVLDRWSSPSKSHIPHLLVLRRRVVDHKFLSCQMGLPPPPMPPTVPQERRAVAQEALACGSKLSLNSFKLIVLHSVPVHFQANHVLVVCALWLADARLSWQTVQLCPPPPTAPEAPQALSPPPTAAEAPQALLQQVPSGTAAHA
jgi:hypothetical protein